MKINDFLNYKRQGRAISMVTAYDYWTARVLSNTDIDVALIGDSVAMVMHGYDTTIAATVEMMVLHTKAVAKGIGKQFILSDMPFLSYRQGLTEAMSVAGELMCAGAHGIKLEGIRGHEALVKHMVGSGIPVMGHLGMTPQSVHQFGGFRVQGKSEDAAEDLIEQAKMVEDAGCFAVVVECVPASVASRMREILQIPVIGIGAGVDVDGQVLVMQDLLGMQTDFNPKFVRKYLDGASLCADALQKFHEDVQSRDFPSAKEAYCMELSKCAK